MFNALGTLGGVSPRSTERIATVANAVTALAIPPGVLSLNLFNSGTYHYIIYIYIYFYQANSKKDAKKLAAFAAEEAAAALNGAEAAFEAVDDKLATALKMLVGSVQSFFYFNPIFFLFSCGEHTSSATRHEKASIVRCLHFRRCEGKATHIHCTTNQ